MLVIYHSALTGCISLIGYTINVFFQNERDKLQQMLLFSLKSYQRAVFSSIHKKKSLPKKVGRCVVIKAPTG